MPKPEILDPQGQAIARALPDLGFDNVTSVRQGKRFEIERRRRRRPARGRPAGGRGDARQPRDRGLHGPARRLASAARPSRRTQVSSGCARHDHRRCCDVPGLARRPRRGARGSSGRRRGRSRSGTAMPTCTASTRWCCPAASPTATTCAAVRSRGSPRWSARSSRPPTRAAGPRHLQRLPGALRGASAARRARPQRRPPLRLPGPGADGRERRHPLDQPATAPATEIVIPVKHGEGRYVADASDARRARARAAGWSSATSAATRTARSTTSPGSRNDRRQRRRPDAAPRARRSTTLTGPSADGLAMFTSVLQALIAA